MGVSIRRVIVFWGLYGGAQNDPSINCSKTLNPKPLYNAKGPKGPPILRNAHARVSPQTREQEGPNVGLRHGVYRV